MWETLPDWFWALYYLFFLATLGTAIFSVVKNKQRGLSILTIVFTVTIPIISLINSIGRVEGMNLNTYLVNCDRGQFGLSLQL